MPGMVNIKTKTFLFLLENFAAPEPPSKPVQGQIYYNTLTKTVNVYDITGWKAVANAQVSRICSYISGKRRSVV